MHILHTEWSDGWGGQEHRVLAEMRGLAARGHTVTLVTRPSCRLREEARRAGLNVVELPLRRAADLGSIAALRGFLKSTAVDVVNTHSGIDTWVGSLAARWAGTPVLLRTRHLNLPLKRHWLNFVHYLPDRIITCGEAMRAQLIEMDGFPAKQLVSIPTGIDFDQFQPKRARGAVRASLGLAEADFVILMVGIIRSVKGHEIALQAFQKVAPKLPRARLVLAGDGPRRANTEQLSRDLGLGDRVHFLGFRGDVADLMAAADVLLLTSKSEGVPQVVTQALGLGMPVVATRVGGVPELITHEQSGWLVPPEDPAATAAALERLAREPELARRLGQAGRAHVWARYSLPAMLDQMERLCRTLLTNKSGAS